MGRKTHRRAKTMGSFLTNCHFYLAVVVHFSLCTSLSVQQSLFSMFFAPTMRMSWRSWKSPCALLSSQVAIFSHALQSSRSFSLVGWKFDAIRRCRMENHWKRSVSQSHLMWTVHFIQFLVWFNCLVASAPTFKIKTREVSIWKFFQCVSKVSNLKVIDSNRNWGIIEAKKYKKRSEKFVRGFCFVSGKTKTHCDWRQSKDNLSSVYAKLVHFGRFGLNFFHLIFHSKRVKYIENRLWKFHCELNFIRLVGHPFSCVCEWIEKSGCNSM